MNPNNNQNAQTPKKQSNGLKLIIVLTVLTVIGIVTVIVLLNNSKDNNAQPNVENVESLGEGPASLSVESESNTAQQQEVIEVSVYVDSVDEPVNAVQANVAYPTDKFEFIGINAKESPFTVEAENKEENGVIKIARGSFDPIKGRQLIAVIQLRAINGSGDADLTITEGSGVISAETAEDVLGSSPALKLTIEEN